MGDALKDLIEALRSGLVGIAFAGALVAQSFWPSATGLKTVLNVMIGTIVACFLAPVILHGVTFYLKITDIPGAIEGSTYFWCGLLGLQVVPLVAKAVNALAVVKGGDK